MKQVLAIMLIATAAAAARGQDAAQAKGPATNLLPNPSFEDGSGQDAQGWTTRAWSGREDARWLVDSPGRAGRRCVSIRSDKGADAAWTATVETRPNTYYRLTGWIRTKDIHGAVGALLNIQNMQHVRTPAVSGTRDWTRVSTVFRTGQVAKLEINCLYGGWGQSTGQAWYDEVCLETLGDKLDPLQATVNVRTDAPSKPYSPMIFGGFLEHFDNQVYGGVFEPGSPLSDENGFRKDVVEAMKELKLSVVRWPGGCFASGYHWRHGVGRDRKAQGDPVWGVVDPNTFGTEEFVRWCRLVGCEPYICTNAGNGTPEEMKEWVEFCNTSDTPAARLRVGGAPLNVRFWSIGNENWGGHEIGARTAQEWGPLVLRSAELMRQADARLTLLAAATPNRAWTLPLLAAAGKHLDYVAIHEYWLPCWRNNLTPDYLSCIMHSEGPENTIRRVVRLLEEAGVRGRTRIAFDEWNLRGWHHPGFPRKQVSDASDPAVAQFIRNRRKNDIASQYTMADALFSASFLNACLRHAEDVGMANIAPIVNTRGPLYVHPKGIVRRTTFHVLAMYANLLQPHVAACEVESFPLANAKVSVPLVDGVATVDASGKAWSLALVNRHPDQAVACTVRLGNAPVEGTHEATVLSGESADAFNDVEKPDRVVPKKTQVRFREGAVALPPHSLTVLRIRSR